jgi:CRP-like cAMP-binding protein
VLAVLGAGEYFGEMAVLSDTSRNATVRARTRMNVVLVPKNDFDQLKTSVPEFEQVFREVATRRSEMKNSA